jgi:pilus assembly protein Flp/PilA
MAEGLNSFGLNFFLSRSTQTMSRILAPFLHFVKSEDGPVAVEYAVMLALIMVACIAIVTTLGQSISGTFSTVNTALGAGS